MKNKSFKTIKLNKRSISNLNNSNRLKGGLNNNAAHNNAAAQYNTGYDCLQNTVWCPLSAMDSCYGPCGLPHGTLGCNGRVKL